MSVEVSWTARARKDLLNIHYWIGTYNPSAADRLYWEIINRALALRGSPFMGRRRPDVHPLVRSVVVKPYGVLYRVKTVSEGMRDSSEIGVEIVRIVHGNRKLDKLF